MSERVIVASRRRLLTPVIVAAVMAPLSWWATQMRFDEFGLAVRAAVFGWAGVVFFSGFFVLSLARYARPSRLRLTPNRLIIEPALRRRRVLPWTDIERFYVWTPPRGADFVAWRYVAGREPESNLIEMSGDPRDGLGNGFGMTVEALAALLEDSRKRAVSDA